MLGMTNTLRSGHKYGLVYAGLGWIIFRNEAQLPDYLKFELHYLGGISILIVFNVRYGGDIYIELFEARKSSYCAILQLSPPWI
jgi:glutamate/tyrosine decarboxylase-like PLP-dependent enzyme